jgi:hypothetical protein
VDYRIGRSDEWRGALFPTLFRYSRFAGKDNLFQLADDFGGLS